ncbi:glycosyltransferase [Thermodesulfobacteriota bacterium]
MIKNIGFVSTRFAGTDGVTLESDKWAQVFETNGHQCFWFAGKLDRNKKSSFLSSEAFFQHKKNSWINDRIIGKKGRTAEVTQAIHDLRSYLKVKLHEFIDRFDIDLIITENVLAIPMHVPLGLALTETIAETQIPTIAHHHDFFWERVRFSINAVNDYISMAFPPHLPNIAHVTINSQAQEQLAHRTGISSSVIPNVLDFENPPHIDSKRGRALRESIGLAPDSMMILQPTRIIRRKGIEHAIELVKSLKHLQCKLVVSHEAGDEGFEYVEWLKDYACEHKVDLCLINTSNGNGNNGAKSGKTTHKLWEIYPFADFITYPSLYEGFGNAFLEAIYYKKPLLVNRYATFVRDIEPLGFDLAVMDGFLSRNTIQRVTEILTSPKRKEKMVDYNYKVAARHYSYHVLRNRLNSILSGFFGDSILPLVEKKDDNRRAVADRPVAFSRPAMAAAPA